MHLIVLLPILALLFGVFGGIIRGLSLLNGYEVQTLLPINGDKFHIILIVLSVISFVILGAICIKCRNLNNFDFEQTFECDNTGVKTVWILSAMIMVLCGAAGFYFSLSSQITSFYSRITEFPLWILAVFTGISIIGLTSILSKKALSEYNAYLVLVPMFWAAFDLIVIFKNNSSSPFVKFYSFELMPPIFLALAFYSFAGLLYSKPKPKFVLFTSLLAIVFSLICIISTVMTHILNPTLWAFDMQTLLRTGCLLGGTIWLLPIVKNICKSM